MAMFETIPTVHMPEQAAVCRPKKEPYVPGGHGVAAAEPMEQYEPIVHMPEQAAVCRPFSEPCKTTVT